MRPLWWIMGFWVRWVAAFVLRWTGGVALTSLAARQFYQNSSLVQKPLWVVLVVHVAIFFVELAFLCAILRWVLT